MSEPRIPEPAKLIVSIIFRSDSSGMAPIEFESSINALEEVYGPTDYRSHAMPFRQTTYYNREMGENLRRVFCSFSRLQERDRLAEIKLFCNSLEKETTDQAGCRIVNIDPGLLSLENLVLATGKNFSHRIYLGRGIFAEVTLLFQQGQFRDLPWTYPDYAGNEVKEVLTTMRQLLHEAVRPAAARV